MSEKVAIQLETLTRLADGFRESRGISNNLTTEQMITLAQEPIKPEQEKTVDITENGSTEIMADEGYVLSKVTANVNVAASAENKFIQLADGTLTEITAQELAGITELRNYAFYNYHNYITVELPNTIKSIGKHAFDEAWVTTINFPEGLETIGNQCFYYSSLRGDITLPSSLISVGENAFGYARITSMVILARLTTIPAAMCNSCTALGSITIPDTVTTIGRIAFLDCRSLLNITIPSSVSNIGDTCFATNNELTSLRTITFLSTIPPTIGSYVFRRNTNLRIIVPAGSGDAYKTATNWAEWADYIEEATA